MFYTLYIQIHAQTLTNKHVEIDQMQGKIDLIYTDGGKKMVFYIFQLQQQKNL